MPDTYTGATLFFGAFALLALGFTAVILGLKKGERTLNELLSLQEEPLSQIESDEEAQEDLARIDAERAASRRDRWAKGEKYDLGTQHALIFASLLTGDWQVWEEEQAIWEFENDI